MYFPIDMSKIIFVYKCISASLNLFLITQELFLIFSNIKAGLDVIQQ